MSVGEAVSGDPGALEAALIGELAATDRFLDQGDPAFTALVPSSARGTEHGLGARLLATLKRDYATVKHVKPAASRADSAELYVLAAGFRGR